ncbi:hypothetical protein HMN09_00153800 [Mycena chlorophos]|uniref:DUF6533 domain-containing protein n=1 Tax=Mycena chlorophos TaxID=658473 RepID=A0A8H6WKR7_MYCCL|nr:hypothetical protein HMN09_00153800 [Mycena chlorophos]
MDIDTLQAEDIRLIFDIKVAFCALLIYDTLLQLDDEYLYIWKARPSIIKWLYLWTRYGTFVGAAAPLIHALVIRSTRCDALTSFTTAFSLFGIGVTFLILMIRTYTLYERSKRLLAFFALIWVAAAAATLWDGISWAHSFPQAESAQSSSCYLSTNTTSHFVLIASWGLLTVECTIFGLTVWKIHQKFSNPPRPRRELWRSLYRDGVWFYPAILPFTIAMLVCLYRAPSGLNEIFDTPVQVMHSILVCRLITHTRSVAAADAAQEARINQVFGHRSRTLSGASTAGSHYGKLSQSSESEEVLDIGPQPVGVQRV